MQESLPIQTQPANRIKFIIGGLLIIAAIIYLIISSTQANAQYFLTIQELNTRGSAVVGQQVRVSGAVLGDSIQYDSQNLVLTFEVANVPGDNKEIEKEGGLAAVLHKAVIDPQAPHMMVVYKGVKPDLLRNEAQAIMTGHIDQNGVFQADELLLKCPTKYQEAVPNQTKG
ncbi:MAG TPA: cytochrome c maturation protein CcmE [Anaerolineaceae bacterium]|nr:cytochrome c maturation protein CcmE [Anaerolineaceae bacterium]